MTLYYKKDKLPRNTEQAIIVIAPKNTPVCQRCDHQKYLDEDVEYRQSSKRDKNLSCSVLHGSRVLFPVHRLVGEYTRDYLTTDN